ncbi:cytochrome C [Lunatibacter salilacus]|uniref:cytochrome C n=1 Tax=Lunatibacter salilacus TaxID=2483804 RepID=UPI00131D9830|nr:cytochrome C [Lunatibacter salilacus]
MEDNRTVKIFLDSDPKPFAEFAPPIKFVLDTTKIPDGKHILKILAKSTSGKEGIKTISFEVRNGPDISVMGIKEGEVVNQQIPITVNSYGSERNDFFMIRGSETPQAIPAWVWALIISFVGFAAFYFTMFWNPDLYKSYF